MRTSSQWSGAWIVLVAVLAFLGGLYTAPLVYPGLSKAPPPGDPVVFSNQHSMRAGLDYRSLADSVHGTLEWWRAQSAERRADPRGWITPEKEREAIARLRG